MFLLFSRLRLIFILLLPLIVYFNNGTCKNISGSTFNGMIGKYSIKIRHICDKIKEVNHAIRDGGSLPQPFKNRIILHGASGNGKTTLARKIAEESGSKFFEISGADIVQRYVGDGAKNIKHIFKIAHDHVEKEYETAIIFIDEIDAITKTDAEYREEHLAATQKLWTELDKIKNDPRIVFICATNNFNKLNNAFLGRFGNNKVEILNPDKKMRKDVLSYYVQLYTGRNWDESLIDSVANQTKGLSIRDLEDFVDGVYTTANIESEGYITKDIIQDVLLDIKKQAKDDVQEKNCIQQAKKFFVWTLSILWTGAITTASGFLVLTILRSNVSM